MIWLNSYLAGFLQAFLVTVFVEFLMICLLTYGVRCPKALEAILICNAFSLPIVWFIIPILVRDNLFYILSSETFAVLSESVILKVLLRLPYSRALLVACIMNAASFAVGWIIEI